MHACSFFIENLPDLFETLGTIHHIYVFSLDESKTLWSVYRALLSFTRSPKGQGPKFLKQANLESYIFSFLSPCAPATAITATVAQPFLFVFVFCRNIL
jgi:hypothetical protein